jgi:hypothetical protein
VGSCGGAKRLGREADHSPPSSAEVKNEDVWGSEGLTLGILNLVIKWRYLSASRSGFFAPRGRPVVHGGEADAGLDAVAMGIVKNYGVGIFS